MAVRRPVSPGCVDLGGGVTDRWRTSSDQSAAAAVRRIASHHRVGRECRRSPTVAKPAALIQRLVRAEARGVESPQMFIATLRSGTLVYLSDMNLRAILIVLATRAGGSVEISNEELYDAMMPASGSGERFVITEIAGGIQVSIQASQQEQAGSN
jgi:hypothetical protein